MDEEKSFWGISAEDMANMEPDELFAKMQEAMSSYGIPIGDVQDDILFEPEPSDFFDALASPTTTSEQIERLLKNGADPNESRKARYGLRENAMSVAVKSGNPDIVRLMIQHGGNAEYIGDKGYSLILDAAHSRDIKDNPRLIELFQVLLEARAEPGINSSYGEFALKSLEQWGHYKAMQFLIENGADTEPLRWTPLIFAVVFGTLGEVRAELAKSPHLDTTDCRELTAMMHALQRGDLERVKMLREAGAELQASNKGYAHPLVCAMTSGNVEAVRYVLDQTQGFTGTRFHENPISEAILSGNKEIVDYILGVFGTHQAYLDEALKDDEEGRFARQLIELGANPNNLGAWARIGVLGHKSSIHPLDQITREQYLAGKKPRFGSANPELVSLPYWDAMIRSRSSAYGGRTHFGDETNSVCGKQDPDWCANRFGQSMTFLPDGRIIEIAGEHEDGYDPDFCIYNDVFEHSPGGSIRVFCYPKEVFPSTDFHSASLVGDWIYIVGCLGYQNERKGKSIPVYRLNIHTFVIEKVETRDSPPCQIFRHSAKLIDANKIMISGGRKLSKGTFKEKTEDNPDSYILDLTTSKWSKV